MENLTLEKLKSALEESWSNDTAHGSVIWSKKNIANGQCAVTALVVNDYFGGEIIWAEAILPNNEKISHYFNLINEEEIDLTRSQFPNGTIIPHGKRKNKNFSTTRDFMLSNEDTLGRYKILKKRVIERL